jgi:hypothetical protein
MIVRICSLCGKYIMQHHIAPGNYCLARYWSDGKMTKKFALPGLVKMVKCPHCSALLWIKEQENVCEIDSCAKGCVLPDRVMIIKKSYEPTIEEYARFQRADAHEKEKEHYAQINAWIAKPEPKYEEGGITDQFKEAKLVSEPTFAEFIDFLSLGVHDRETERYVRLHVWWAGNDPRRQGGQAAPMTQVETASLRALLPFLDESNDFDRFMKAEGFRELGEFSAAEKLLATPFDNEMLRTGASFIRDLNRKQCTAVEEITAWYPLKPH